MLLHCHIFIFFELILIDSKLDRKDEVNVVNEVTYFTIHFTFSIICFNDV